MENRELLNHVKNGDSDAVLLALRHKGAIYRINGLINLVRHSLDSQIIIQEAEKLCYDDTFLDGYTVSDFAYAALDLIQFRKYSGKNDKIYQLIKSKFKF